MPNTFAERLSAPERKTLADVCGKQAKADLHPQVPATDLRGPAVEARERTVKLESAAADIGIHQSRLSHKFSDGSITLRELGRLGPDYAAEFGRQLVEQYGPLSDPKDRIRRKCDEMQAILNEVRQFVEVS